MTTPEPAALPDPNTGEPRPPRAPVESNWRSYDRAKDLKPDLPPEGKGPALEWFADSRQFRWQVSLLAFLVLVIFAVLKDGTHWMQAWWMWLIIVGFSSLFMLGRKNMKMTAGADWLRVKNVWLDTYRLKKVEVTEDTKPGVRIVLADQRYELDTKILNLQKNRDLWDLVYNGILHSVQNGAKVNGRAVRHFNLENLARNRSIGD